MSHRRIAEKRSSYPRLSQTLHISDWHLSRNAHTQREIKFDQSTLALWAMQYADTIQREPLEMPHLTPLYSIDHHVQACQLRRYGHLHLLKTPSFQTSRPLNAAVSNTTRYTCIPPTIVSPTQLPRYQGVMMCYRRYQSSMSSTYKLAPQ